MILNNSDRPESCVSSSAKSIGVPLPGARTNSTELGSGTGLVFQTPHAVGPEVTVGLGLEDKLRLLEEGSIGPILSVKESVRMDLAREGPSWTGTYAVEDVVIHGRPYRLTQELTGTMTTEDDELVFEIPEFEIFVRGGDDGAVVRELNTEFENLFDDFVQADDSILSPRGLKVKDRLRVLLGLT